MRETAQVSQTTPRAVFDDNIKMPDSQLQKVLPLDGILRRGRARKHVHVLQDLFREGKLGHALVQFFRDFLRARQRAAMRRANGRESACAAGWALDLGSDQGRTCVGHRR